MRFEKGEKKFGKSELELGSIASKTMGPSTPLKLILNLRFFLVLTNYHMLVDEVSVISLC